MTYAAAGLLALIGIAHSALGERLFVRPLLAGDLHVDMPADVARRIIRFAWHLTTLAWIGLAAALAGADIVWVFAFVCLSACAIILAAAPGHLAWPFFLAAAFLSLVDADRIPRTGLWVIVVCAAVVSAIAGLAHAAWAVGVRAGSRNVIPQSPASHEPTFRPVGPLTFVIAVLLLGFAALIVAYGASASVLEPLGSWPRIALVAGLVVLAARVVGDGRWVGVTKRIRETGFAAADDRWWTPAAALLALGAGASLLLG